MNQPIITKIDAIKVLRNLPCSISAGTNITGQTVYTCAVNLGLKEAKDLVEAIMALDNRDLIIAREQINKMHDTIARQNDIMHEVYSLREKLSRIRNAVNE